MHKWRHDEGASTSGAQREASPGQPRVGGCAGCFGIRFEVENVGKGRVTRLEAWVSSATSQQLSQSGESKWVHCDQRRDSRRRVPCSLSSLQPQLTAAAPPPLPECPSNNLTMVGCATTASLISMLPIKPVGDKRCIPVPCLSQPLILFSHLLPLQKQHMAAAPWTKHASSGPI